ncbi:MAG: tRNA (adenosine(37)-N6)-threonylcarbamoyltransferase complex ATPase subunit type 1 TsaE [Paludibacteraceae bacterium]|nr:tRNA (adenosine(37)-N6)-threonylcarbamoyltransferase complex ATPase subunit type 1 TsaE [Paludibacteraceae bacterium]
MQEYILTLTENGLLIKTLDGTPCKASDILQVFPESRVYAFRGSMGAGKTTFIKNLCSTLGVTDVVNSPTFAIVNVYQDTNGDDIYHFDCYRLKNIREALDLGAEEYLYSGCLCFIEWPEMIDDLLPEDHVDVTILPLQDGNRLLTVSRRI